MDTSAPKRSTSYIPTLDGWRAVAIVTVIVSHYPVDPSYRVATAWGRLGVDLFFAISGYLICHRLIDELYRNGSISLAGFYKRRAFRILPLYLFYLCFLMVVSHLADVHVSHQEVADCLVFVRNYSRPPLGTYTNHFWSLSGEEHFYLLWPCFLAVVGLRRALWITPALALTVHVWRSFEARSHLFDSLLTNDMIWRTDTRLDALLWGCFAAMLCFRRTFRVPGWLPFLTLTSLWAAVFFHAPAQPLVFALLFPLLVVSTVFNAEGFAGRFLELAPVRWLGRLSYSLYIWQTLFLQSTSPPDPAWLTALKQWPVNLCLIVGLATASHYLLEQPFIRLGRKATQMRGADFSVASPAS